MFQRQSATWPLAQVRLKLETPLFVMEALLEAAGHLLANELSTAEEEARAVALVRTR